MALSVGTRIGVHEIVALLGAGGTGGVYRARDTKLGRDVALKILLPAFTADADRVARFEREARVLASLSHLHIGAIFGFEDTGNVPALVLELVEGDTLHDRVRRGPLRFPEALDVAQQIAEAARCRPRGRDHPSRSQTSHLPNPDVSSPLFSSVLAIHFSAAVEQKTAGFTLSIADLEALANGETVMLSNGGGDTIRIELVANFPDYVQRQDIPTLVRGSNPFGVVVAANNLYVTDGGRNLVWAVDLARGTHAPLVEFPPVVNPLFGVPGLPGGPTVEAVPTGIAYADGQLLVTLLRGLPFPANTSTVVHVDPSTQEQSAFISGLKTAIGVTEIQNGGDADYLVLQHSSGPGPFFGGPGQVLLFESSDSTPTLLAGCLTRPSAMVFDDKTGVLYVAEIGGRVVALTIGS